VELLFRELMSLYGLEKFQTSDPAIVHLLLVAALLTLTVSRALLGVFQELFPETVFPGGAGRRPSGLSPSSPSKT
jgi:IS4 transposase